MSRDLYILLTGRLFSCPICRLENKNGRSKGFKNLFALKCHIEKIHKNTTNQNIDQAKALILVEAAELCLKYGVIPR